MLDTWCSNQEQPVNNYSKYVLRSAAQGDFSWYLPVGQQLRVSSLLQFFSSPVLPLASSFSRPALFSSRFHEV